MVGGRWVCIFWLLVFWLGTRVLTRSNFNVSSVDLVDITPCTVKSPFYYYIALGNRRLVPVSLMLQYRNIPDNNTDGPRYLGIEIHIGDGSGSNSRQRRTSLRRPIGNCLERAMAGDGAIYIVPSPPEPAILHFSTSILHSTLCSISTPHLHSPFSSSFLQLYSSLLFSIPIQDISNIWLPRQRSRRLGASRSIPPFHPRIQLKWAYRACASNKKKKKNNPPPHVHKHFLFPIPLSPPALSPSPPPTSLPDFYPSSYLLSPSWTSPPLPRDVSLRATRSNTRPNTSPTSSRQPSPPPSTSAGTAPTMKPGTPSPPRKSSQLGSPVALISARCLTGLYSSRPAPPQSRKPPRRNDISMLSMRTIIRELPATVASSG